MCGRFTLRNPRGHAWLAATPDELGAPRYNIAPSQPLVAVARDREGRRVVRGVDWGFRPKWLTGNRKAPINARAEGLADKPMFRRAFAAGRCLIPADGWYEWQAQEAGPKQPWFFHRPDDGVFWFAGIAARDADGRANAAVITRPSAVAFAAVHERMPAVLRDDDAAAQWIQPNAAREQLLELLMPGSPKPRDDALGLEMVPVSRAVNRVSNDGPELVKAVE